MSTVYQHQLHAHKPRRHWHIKRWLIVLTALLTLDLPLWAADQCPLCAAGQPIVKPGSR